MSIAAGMPRTLHVLTGPTASGKTELALQWAESHGAEIVSCDSLLLYRGMDIGTAKPTPAERARVPHHLIDVCGLREQASVTYYVTRAREAIDRIAARGRRVLVVGGSGFYLKSFFAPVADAVTVPPGLRARVAALADAEGLPGVLAELRQLNPDGLGSLDTNNPRRVTRALERCLASGRSLAEMAEAFARQPAPFCDWQVESVRLERAPDELNGRIERRVQAMLDDGLVGEVESLLGQGLKENASAAAAIGYRETIALLEGRLAPEELAAEIVRNTKSLVKKQRTWFRTQLPEHCIVEAAGANAATLFAGCG